MSENKNINKEAVEQANAEKNTLTARDVWDQIVKLQDQLSNIEEIVRSINMLDTKDRVYNDDGELICDYSTEATMEKIKTMQSAIVSRETTLQKMLDYYYSIFRMMNE